MSQVEQGGVTLTDPFVLCRNPSGFTRWRAPVCRRGRHLPKRSEDKLCERKNIDARLQGGRRRREKKHKCKYFKRSVPLHHCWLCVILWASTNNGRWDFFFFFCRSPPKKKDGKKNWQSRKHCCYLCHCDGTSKWAQRFFVRKLNVPHIRLTASFTRGLNWNPNISDF